MTLPDLLDSACGVQTPSSRQSSEPGMEGHALRDGHEGGSNGGIAYRPPSRLLALPCLALASRAGASADLCRWLDSPSTLSSGESSPRRLTRTRSSSEAFRWILCSGPDLTGPSRMRIFAPNDVVAKSRFWYYLRQLKKVKKASGEIVALNVVRNNLNPHSGVLTDCRRFTRRSL